MRTSRFIPIASSVAAALLGGCTIDRTVALDTVPTTVASVPAVVTPAPTVVTPAPPVVTPAPAVVTPAPAVIVR